MIQLTKPTTRIVAHHAGDPDDFTARPCRFHCGCGQSFIGRHFEALALADVHRCRPTCAHDWAGNHCQVTGVPVVECMECGAVELRELTDQERASILAFED